MSSPSKLFYLRGLRGKAARLREVSAPPTNDFGSLFSTSHDFGRASFCRDGYTLDFNEHASAIPYPRQPTFEPAHASAYQRHRQMRAPSSSDASEQAALAAGFRIAGVGVHTSIVSVACCVSAAMKLAGEGSEAAREGRNCEAMLVKTMYNHRQNEATTEVVAQWKTGTEIVSWRRAQLRADEQPCRADRQVEQLRTANLIRPTFSTLSTPFEL